MKQLVFKLKTILTMSTIIMVSIILFFDSKTLNSLVLDYDNDFVIEEVASVSDSSDEEQEEVIVEDNNSSTVTMLSNKASLDYWAWPTEDSYVITSYFGYRWGSMHEAVDISGPGYGSNIYAANSGEVVSVMSGCIAGDIYCNGSGGNYVVINHNINNYYTIYMHLSNIYVNVGQVVNRGDVIGSMGNTGNVVPVPTYDNPYAGTHLHFGLYIGEPYNGGYAINPLDLY